MDYTKDLQTMKPKELRDFVASTMGDVQSISEIQKKIQTSATAINNQQTELERILNESREVKMKLDTIKEQIEEYADNLLSADDDDTNSIESKICKTTSEIEKLYKNAQDTLAGIKKISETSENSYKELFNKIESLLPAATSAGLASSYREAQQAMKWTPLIWVGFAIVNIVLFFWYAYAYVSFADAEKGKEIASFFAHIVTGSPLIWLAWYLQRTISQNARIKHEYNHKQRVMSLYEGFSRVIDKSGSEEQEQKLLDIMLEAVQLNPSTIIDGKETFFENLLKYFGKMNPIKQNSGEM